MSDQVQGKRGKRGEIKEGWEEEGGIFHLTSAQLNQDILLVDDVHVEYSSK